MQKSKKTLALILTGTLLLSALPATLYAQAAKKVKLSSKSITMTVGQKKVLKLKNYAGKKKVSWKINKKIAKISSTGKGKSQLKITAQKTGNAIITATASGKKYTCKLKVKASQTATEPMNTEPVAITPAPAASSEPSATPLITETPAQESTPSPTAATPTNPPKDMSWWLNDRFGMFIHLGSYSQYGQGEWAMHVQKISKEDYQTNISSNFNPENFNAEEIVSAAKNAGMKYIVITAKHHEGFSMWDTKVESFKDYTGTKMYDLQQYTPFGSTGRDILKELKDACDEAGLKFGLYYSIIDWNHSSQEIYSDFTVMSSMEARTDYINDMKAQLKELVDLYDPAVLWFDGDWTYYKKEPTLKKWWTKSDGQDLYNYIYSLNPKILVNERVCRGFKLGDFECPEQTIPSSPLSRPWETCQTMNGAWGYDESKESDYYSSSKMIGELADVVSKGGNYLLNIGPKGDGSITSGSVEMLSAFGEWMQKNSESIYGASQTPFKSAPSWGVYTTKEDTLYAHVLNGESGSIISECWKEDGPKKVYVLATGQELSFTVEDGNVSFTIPEDVVDPADTVIALEY